MIEFNQKVLYTRINERCRIKFLNGKNLLYYIDKSFIELVKKLKSVNFILKDFEINLFN